MDKVGFRMENNTFKGSLFGGFNREDVIDYIKKTSAESTARIESLESDIDKLCAQEDKLRVQLDCAENEKSKLKERLERATNNLTDARASLDSANNDLSILRAEAEVMREELATLRAENASLRAESASFRPMAEQYSTVKEHLAGIELDAHQRAEEYERSVRARLAAAIGECRAQCDTVLATLSNTCISVTGELRRAENSVSTLPAAFNTLRAGLEKLEEDK